MLLGLVSWLSVSDGWTGSGSTGGRYDDYWWTRSLTASTNKLIAYIENTGILRPSYDPGSSSSSKWGVAFGFSTMPMLRFGARLVDENSLAE